LQRPRASTRFFARFARLGHSGTISHQPPVFAAGSGRLFAIFAFRDALADMAGKACSHALNLFAYTAQVVGSSRRKQGKCVRMPWVAVDHIAAFRNPECAQTGP
jgi:hypothetical protein